MMYLLSIVIVALLGCQSSFALQTEWNGVYSDPIYGGNIFVCVSEVGGVYYGQATFSLIGYMRGTIDVNNVFTGESWTHGWEGLQGTFSLTLTGATYTGTVTQKPGITYTMTGTQSSSIEPSNLECQKSDDYLLGSTVEFDSSGSFQSESEAGLRMDDSISDGTVTASYQYLWEDGFLAHGVDFNKRHLYGQVQTGMWYEPGSDEGTNMHVVKNATHHYTSWWFLSRIGEFDYSIRNEPDMQGHGLYARDSTVLMASLEADENACYAQWTTNAEKDCLEVVDVEADDEEVAAIMREATLAFAVLSFISILVFGVLILQKVGSSAPAMSEQSKL